MKIRILIDLEPEIHKALNHKAIDCGMYLKTYIQERLTELAKRKKGKTSPLDF
jgi:predicted HicB family RNase H-like nuclease